MSTLKTYIDESIVLEFLQQNFDKKVAFITKLSGGEVSQAFSFAVKKDYVIRVSTEIESFEKDKYAAEHFASSDIPIPNIVDMGKIGEKFYAISEKAAGMTVNLLDTQTQQKLIQQLIRISEAIREIKIGDTKKFGDWDEHGQGYFDSWNQFMTDKKDDVYGNWEHLYATTFLEKELVEKIHRKMVSLIPYLPEIHCLVHGDFGGNNAVSDGEKITGIIDWGQSKYGDFLYDVAWIDFWTDTDHQTPYLQHYRKNGIPVQYFLERVLCYKLRLGVGALGFFALSGQRNSYNWTRDRLLALT